jgi:carbamoyltransferase
MKSYFIGINGSFHDAAVCVLSAEQNEPVLMLSEDRHSGIPHHFGFPFKSLEIAINQVGAENISAVGYSRDRNCFKNPPEAYFSDILDEKADAFIRNEIIHLLERMESTFPDMNYIPEKVNSIISILPQSSELTTIRKRICYLLLRYHNELTTEKNIADILPHVPITGFLHHDTHAATYYASPFSDAAVVTWDGRGEFDSTVLTHGSGNTLERIQAIKHPLSIGNFYETFADYIGLGRVEGPGKLMGLAAYGDDRYVTTFSRLLTVDDTNFDFTFNTEFLSYSQSEPLRANQHLIELIGKGRERDEPIDENHKAIAFAVQKTTEDVCTQLIKNACNILKTQNVVLSGGLSLNCVMNEKLRANLGIEPFLIPPCGDDGTALGSAILLREEFFKKNQKSDGSHRLKYFNSYGTQNSSEKINQYLDDNNFAYEDISPQTVARLLADGQIIGCLSGKYEFGPRALGFRSILTDPQPVENWPRVNNTIKFREDFRPFAPIMLKEDAERFWGDESIATDSPFMLLAPKMSEESGALLGAVTHRDLSARVQTLEANFNPLVYEILLEFKKQTGVGVLMNTSLNMSGESIIIDFEDLILFMAHSELDAVILENVLVKRSKNQECIKMLLSEIPDRKAYLDHRKNRYTQDLAETRSTTPYINFSQYYLFLYNEKVS